MRGSPSQLYLEVLPEDKGEWINRSKDVRAQYEKIKEKVSASRRSKGLQSNILLAYYCMHSVRRLSPFLIVPLSVRLLSHVCLSQHITNPRKAAGQQDLVVNNPLSQDEGVSVCGMLSGRVNRLDIQQLTNKDLFIQ